MSQKYPNPKYREETTPCRDKVYTYGRLEVLIFPQHVIYKALLHISTAVNVNPQAVLLNS